MNSPGSALVQLISLDDAAERLSLSKRTLQREIVRGRFPEPIVIGKTCLRIRVSDLDAYIEFLRSDKSRAPYLRKNPTMGAFASWMDEEMLRKVRDVKEDADQGRESHDRDGALRS